MSRPKPLPYTDAADVRWHGFDRQCPPLRRIYTGEGWPPDPCRAVTPGRGTLATTCVRLFVRAPAIPEDEGRPVVYLASLLAPTEADVADLSPATPAAQFARALRIGPNYPPPTGDDLDERRRRLRARAAAELAWRATMYAEHPAL
jgi:hypothetical protein